MITLYGNNFFGDRNHLIRRTKCNHIGQTRKRFFISMSHSHTTANSDIETDQIILFNDRNKSEAMCKDIDVIVWWNRHSNLKLARQISRSIERLNLCAATVKRTFWQIH